MSSLPTLSISGWIDTVDGKADRLMAYFFTSEYSQTYTFHKSIASLPYIIATYGHDAIQLKSMISSTLFDLFVHYFDEADFNVSIKERDNIILDIQVSGSFEDDGVRYDLAHLIHLNNGVMGKIIKLNNG